MKKQTYDELKKKVDELERFVNGGKGSGNFGHAGRPGEVGGSSRSATTTARLARGDKVAEAQLKADELERERDRAIDDKPFAEYEKIRDKAEKARREARILEDENERLSQEEIERGQAKKREQDTPGKKETAEALEETKKAMAKSKAAFEKMETMRYGTEEYKKADEAYQKAYKKTKEAGSKLNALVASQMVNDKEFNDSLKQHIEDGLGVKLKDFKLHTREYTDRWGDKNTTVQGRTRLNNKDLGAFGKVLSYTDVDFGGNMSNDSRYMDNFGSIWGRVTLEYESRHHGGNGQNVLSVRYYPDGTYDIRDYRGV